jgi:vacuolar protein 8
MHKLKGKLWRFIKGSSQVKMADIDGLVSVLSEGDDVAKAAAARALFNLVLRGRLSGSTRTKASEKAAIAEAGGIPLLVELVRDGSADAKCHAARVLGHIALDNDANRILVAEAGAIPPLVELLRDGSAVAKAEPAWEPAWALYILAWNNANNQVLIVEAGGIPPLVELLRNGSAEAKEKAVWALRSLARNNDANAVAIAVAVGFEALVQLARRGGVTYDNVTVVHDAGVPAKRKAALVVATLLRDSVPDSVPDEMRALIAPYL